MIFKHFVFPVLPFIATIGLALPNIAPFCQLALAEEATVLSREAVVGSVLSSHPLIKAVSEEAAMAEGENLSAQGAFDPSLKGESSSYAFGDYSGTSENLGVELPLEWQGARLGAGYRRGGGTFPIYDDILATNNGGEFRAGIEIPLLRDGPIDRRRALMERTLLQKVVAAKNIQQRKIELVRAANLTYWEWVATRFKRQIYQDLLQVAEVRDGHLSQRVKKGDLPQFDLTDNKRALLQRRSQLLSAEAQLRKSEFELSLLYRDAEGAPRSVINLKHPTVFPNPPMELLPEELYIEEAIRARPELERLTQQIAQNDVELKLSENQMLPKLDLQLASSADTGAGSTSRDEGELKVAVKLEVPLQQRTQRGKIQALQAKNREVTQLRTFAEQRISTDVQDASTALKLARERLAVAQQEVKAALDLEAGERTRLELGDSNLIFVNLREQTSADAKVREIDALSDCWKAWAHLQAARGQTE